MRAARSRMPCSPSVAALSGHTGEALEGWYSNHRVDVDQALRMMTAGPAFAAFQEKDVGTLSVGRYADFTVLSASPYQMPTTS